MRSLLKYKTYHCYNNRKCDISLEKRKSCKLCRFILCLKAGMNAESEKFNLISISFLFINFNKLQIKVLSSLKRKHQMI